MHHGTRGNGGCSSLRCDGGWLEGTIQCFCSHMEQVDGEDVRTAGLCKQHNWVHQPAPVIRHVISTLADHGRVSYYFNV